MNKDTSKSVSVIFEEKPKQWGLRGDSYLWEDMQKVFSTVPITISQDDFVKKFELAFEEITGTPLTYDDYICFPKYAHGGMSSGQISGEFWIDKALPLLLERLRKFQ